MNEAIKRTVLITGAAGGIGCALVKKFSDEGFNVVATDQMANCDVPDSAQYVQINLQKLATDGIYRLKALQELKGTLPDNRLDVLINNAAVQILDPISDIRIDDWNATVSINLTAPLLLTQAFLEQLSENNGSIINISSIHATRTKPGFLSYSTSKAGLSGLTRAMAVEIGSRVRVNAIEPAAIDTPMLSAGLSMEELDALGALHPTRKIGNPEEIAEVAIVLAGSQKFINGACISVSGGIDCLLVDPTNQ